MTDMGTAICPKCGASRTEDEKFCGQCGESFVTNASSSVPPIGNIAEKYQKQVHTGKVRSGRGAILAVAILTIIGGIGLYFKDKADISTIERADKEQYELEGKTVSKAELIKMANEEAVTLLVTNLVLAGIFFGLWGWAKKSPLPATITALILYVTLWGVSALLNPVNLVSGILVKIIVVVVLAKGIKSALAYRKPQQEGQM